MVTKSTIDFISQQITLQICNIIKFYMMKKELLLDEFFVFYSS